MLSDIDRCRNPVRPGRVEPRRVKRGDKQYPWLNIPRALAREQCLTQWHSVRYSTVAYAEATTVSLLGWTAGPIENALIGIAMVMERRYTVDLAGATWPDCKTN